MKLVLFYSFLFSLLFLFSTEQISAQTDDLYKDGTVWNVTFIRTAANRTDDYLKGLAQTWAAMMEESKKEGLIVSYKILQGNSANKEDFDLMLMIEYKDFASLDPDPTRDAKFDALEKKIKDQMGEKYQSTISNYSEIRDLLGSKLMREKHLK